MKEFQCICISCNKHDGDVNDKDFCAGKICARECEIVICTPHKECPSKLD